VTSVENKYGQTTISKYDYSNDDLGRRTAMGKSGTAFSQADTISYGYNDKSEVTSAVAQNRTTFNYLYNFDNLGNRRTSTSSETGTPVQTAYTANSLNQYSLINDGNAKTPAYDFDGNMTSDGGNWTYTWDAENRLSRAVNGSTVIDYKYDYGFSRVEKKVTESGTVTKLERYVYDNFLQIERLNGLDSNAIEKKRIWGGEGKVIADINSSGTSFYAFGDENKNITEYIDGSGTIQGHYEFSPFGKVIVASGSNPDAFDFRFSSEYLDTETGLVYYNYRYYSPELGRWCSRDPIGERGGWNLYAMVENDPGNWWDWLGLCTIVAPSPADIEKMKKDVSEIEEELWWERLEDLFDKNREELQRQCECYKECDPAQYRICMSLAAQNAFAQAMAEVGEKPQPKSTDNDTPVELEGFVGFLDRFFNREANPNTVVVVPPPFLPGRVNLFPKFPTMKAAEDAADSVGRYQKKVKGKTKTMPSEKHKKGDRHFHDKNHENPKKPNKHYCFPD